MIVENLEQILERVTTLPQLPDTTLRLIRVINDPATTFRQIVDTIRYDQTITTELLRLCNSAYFGLSRRVSSVDDAVRYLGTAKVLQLVMAAHTHALLSQPQEGYGLQPGMLWVHSVAVAYACQIMGERLALPDRGVLFTAGLLHDVGKILLNEYVASEYARIAEIVSTRKISFHEAEREVLGFTHAQVGAEIAERWSLPEVIVRCIRYHHEPAALPAPDPVVDAVHLADAMCILMGVGGGDDGLAYRADAAVAERHGLVEYEFESMGATVVAQLKSIQEVFSSSQGDSDARKRTHR